MTDEFSLKDLKKKHKVYRFGILPLNIPFLSPQIELNIALFAA